MRRTTTWNSLHPRLCSRNHVLHPLHIVMLREVRNHELFEIRDTPRHCTDPVQPDPSGSRAPPSRCDQCYTPSFVVHAVHIITLRHDVLQLRASDVSSASPAMYTTSHTSLTTDTRLALTSETEWSPRQDHEPARTWLRTNVTPRLHRCFEHLR